MTFPISFEQFRTNFGTYPVPSVLESLLEFESASQEWYSTGFELDVLPQEVLKHHIKEEVISQFYYFGHDGNDSMYALWRYKEVPLDHAPVVYLSSEGEGSGVLADNLTEFLTLLAYGTEPIFGVYPLRTNEDMKYIKRNTEFRAWLDQKYHLRAAEHPNNVVQQARHRYPRVPLIY